MRIGKAISVSAMFFTLALTNLPTSAEGRGDVSGTPTAADTAFPAWAYPWDPNVELPPGDDEPRRVPGSLATFSMAQARDLYFAPDWHRACRLAGRIAWPSLTAPLALAAAAGGARRRDPNAGAASRTDSPPTLRRASRRCRTDRRGAHAGHPESGTGAPGPVP